MHRSSFRAGTMTVTDEVEGIVAGGTDTVVLAVRTKFRRRSLVPRLTVLFPNEAERGAAEDTPPTTVPCVSEMSCWLICHPLPGHPRPLKLGPDLTKFPACRIARGGLQRPLNPDGEQALHRQVLAQVAPGRLPPLPVIG